MWRWRLCLSLFEQPPATPGAGVGGCGAAAAAGLVADEALSAVCAGSNALRVPLRWWLSETLHTGDDWDVCAAVCVPACSQGCSGCVWLLHADRQAALGVCGDGVCCGVVGGVFLYWRGLRYGREPCGVLHDASLSWELVQQFCQER